MIELDKYYDVIIVGAGVAGLNCALNLPRDRKILIICKDTPDKSDSYLAQGGICRLVDEDDYQGYFEDTMRAGHYENNPATVDCMIRNSQELIDDLIACGVRFAKNADGSLAYTREGGIPVRASASTKTARAGRLPPTLCRRCARAATYSSRPTLRWLI